MESSRFKELLAAAKEMGVCQFQLTPEGGLSVIFGPESPRPQLPGGLLPSDYASPDISPPSWVTADLDAPFNPDLEPE